jgi:hypothetical protein
VTMVTCMSDPGHILRQTIIVKRRRKVGKPKEGGRLHRACKGKKRNTKLDYTAHAVDSMGGAKETPPRQNQRVTRGIARSPLSDLRHLLVPVSHQPPRLQSLSNIDA